MAVADYSSDPDGNTSINGINIAEDCSPAGINNALRQLMADVKVFYDGVPTSGTFMPKSGGVFSGTQPIFTGRGAYLHHNNATFASGRVFFQATGGGTPSGMTAGDWLLEY